MKKIILIITGSIAAPKALVLYDLLKQKYQVTILATPNAKKFVRFPKTLKVYDQFLTQDFYQKDDQIDHTDFALNCDLIIVYPATMNFISKASLAICDNLALATFFASSTKKIIFPAMNHNMYHNQGLQNNLAFLAQDFNVAIVNPDQGLLACKMMGYGRVKEPEVAFKIVENYLQQSKKLTNKIVLINYGAARAYLDDVRYLTVGSSGKMGQALVSAFLALNAQVIAVVGDINVTLLQHQNLTIIKANTNQNILAVMKKYFAEADIVICAAALNDYQLEKPWTGKINKSQQEKLQVNLVTNVDVLASLAKTKTKQLLIGFSAQDNYDFAIAKKKMITKNCDGIIMNHINVINQNTTEVKFYFKNQCYHFKGSKIEVAKAIVEVISN